MNLAFSHLTAIDDIPSTQWNELCQDDYPFLKHAFLSALESSGSVATETGWQPFHLIAKTTCDDKVMAAIPLYIKTHSYGEYIFDWAWADAYRRYGYHYYPKLLAAIPFTPVSGPRMLINNAMDKHQVELQLLEHLQATCEKMGLSSCHLLYPPNEVEQQKWLTRHSVQFQWHNNQYQSFEQFLDTFTSRKRKNVKKERAKISQQGIKINRLAAEHIAQSDIDFFYHCYRETYLKRSGHEGYLNLDCFRTWWHSMQENMMLVVASNNESPIASALYFFNENGLYGRYWGSLADVDALHFECCYYQGIEFAIERQLPLFNPGTQGEHKIQRGFTPITCCSAHWIAEPAFSSAIEHFTVQERQQLARYKKEAETLLPFKCLG